MTPKKVLIVDDSLAISRQLQHIIENTSEFEVAGMAKNGLEGMKLFKSLKPDIVIMDLIMPEMDGLQAIRNIIAIDNKAQIVVISSMGGVGDKVMEALDLGAQQIITKPFEAEKVIEVLRKS